MEKSMFRSENFSACFVLLLAACTVHFAHLDIAKQMSKSNSWQTRRFIMNPKMAKATTLGFDRVLADINWLLFIQYYGDPQSSKNEKLRYAPDYLHLIIALDPHFIKPYWFASYVLAGEMSTYLKKQGNKEESAKFFKDAESIMDQGIADNPKEWSLPYIAAFNQYLFAADTKKAAYYYRVASKIPDSPKWLANQALVMESKAPDLIKRIRTLEINFLHSSGLAREETRHMLQLLWSQMFYEAPNDVYRNRAKDKLKQFEVLLLEKKDLPQLGDSDFIERDKMREITPETDSNSGTRKEGSAK